jgi:hypothetical protein
VIGWNMMMNPVVIPAAASTPAPARIQSRLLFFAWTTFT